MSVSPPKMPAAVDVRGSQLFEALMRLSYFNVPQAIPELDDPAALTAQAEAVLPAVKTRRDDAQGILRRARENDANASPEQRIRTARAVFAMILGREYPVMLRFQMPLQSETLSDQPVGVSSDPHAAAGWLLKMVRVRPELVPLRGLITTAEALRDQPLFAFRVAQVPTVAGEAWTGVARPNDEGADRLSLVLTGNGDLSALGGEICGLVLDQWAERIPSNYEMTGLTFHFDAPTSRPPQSLLLAVPPEDATWDFGLVVDTVREAFALARIRAVAPETLGEYGQHIPAVFLSQDLDMTGAADDV